MMNFGPIKGRPIKAKSIDQNQSDQINKGFNQSKDTPSKSDNEVLSTGQSVNEKPTPTRRRFSRPAESQGNLDNAIDKLVEDARKEADK